jgi:hypothetical protein
VIGQRAMDELVSVLQTPGAVTTKNLSMLDRVVLSALNDDPAQAIEVLVRHFFSSDSPATLCSFALNTRESIRKRSQQDLFSQLATRALESSFWNSDSPNFAAALNASLIYGPPFIFSDHDRFVSLVCRSLPSVGSRLMAASTVLDSYVTDDQLLITSSVPDDFCDVIGGLTRTTTTFSLLGTSILRVLDTPANFEATFKLVRIFARILAKLFPPKLSIPSSMAANSCLF